MNPDLLIVPRGRFTAIAEEVIAKYTNLDALDSPNEYKHEVRNLEIRIESAIDDEVYSYLQERRLT